LTTISKLRTDGRRDWGRTDRGAWRAVVLLVRALAALAGVALGALAALTCADVLLRAFGMPIKGTFDLVRVLGALTIACAVPLTTAVKGHVAVEYFFNKLGRAGRLAVDSVMRLLMIGMFACAARQCVVYGFRFLRSGEVTATLELPVFWVPWVVAAACILSAVVVLYHLLFPGRELVRL